MIDDKLLTSLLNKEVIINDNETGTLFDWDEKTITIQKRVNEDMFKLVEIEKWKIKNIKRK